MTRPLRIALLATARYPISEPFTGGLASHISTLARGLSSRGHEVTVIASEGTSLGPGVAVRSLGPESGLQFSEAARRDASMLADSFMAEHHAYLSFLTGLSRSCEFDVVHNHSFHYLPITMAPVIRAAHVTTFHAPPTPWQESAALCLPPGDRPLFLTVSGSNQRTWLKSLPDVEVVPNGIDLSQWSVSTSAADDLAVWTGRLVPEKGPHFAIDAARQAGLRVVLAGPISDEEYFEHEVKPRLGSDAEYAGHLAQRELSHLIGECGVALSTPCWEEPYGLTTVESLACGTPVAAFDRGAMRSLLCDRSGRLSAPNSARALADAALAAAGLSRVDARARAEKVASLDRMVDGIEAAYGRALARESGSA